MTPPHEQPDRRRVQRIPIFLDAAAREPARSKVPVRVVDISAQGCRIEVLSGVFAGSSVWLSISNLENQQARVVWQNDGFAGLEFASPLSEVVLNSLVFACPPTSKAVISSLRDVAQRTRRVAGQSLDRDTADALRELSRDCSVAAIVQGFRLLDREAPEATIPQLSGAMVRRRISSQLMEPGFSFRW